MHLGLMVGKIFSVPDALFVSKSFSGEIIPLAHFQRDNPTQVNEENTQGKHLQ